MIKESAGMDAKLIGKISKKSNYWPLRPFYALCHIDGAINHIFWMGILHHDRWTDAAGASVAVGNPATMTTLNQQHIFYRGTDGAINHIFWDGTFHYDRWTDAAGTPVAADDPATMVTPNQQHIFYRGVDCD